MAYSKIDALRNACGAATATAKELDAALVEVARLQKDLVSRLTILRRAAVDAGVRKADAEAVPNRWSSLETIGAVLAREGLGYPHALGFASDRYLNDAIEADAARLVRYAREAADAA